MMPECPTGRGNNMAVDAESIRCSRSRADGKTTDAWNEIAARELPV